MEVEWEPLSFPTEEFIEDFCSCGNDCTCEESKDIEWAWDDRVLTESSLLSNSKLKVEFHPYHSRGTAAVRGFKPLEKGRHHFWEIKMLTSIYGTDVMVGIGTEKVALQSMNYCSLLGQDKESWGLSYKGRIYHGGESRSYECRFSKGSIVGVHLDTWMGTLRFFLDRKPLGIAFTRLRDVELYPMVCSTAAKSKMIITTSCSAPASLQMSCLSLLKPFHRLYLSTAFPGLRYLVDGVFAEVLSNKREFEDENEESEEEYEFFNNLIFDDFDFALIGLKKKKKLKVN